MPADTRVRSDCSWRSGQSSVRKHKRVAVEFGKQLTVFGDGYAAEQILAFDAADARAVLASV